MFCAHIATIEDIGFYASMLRDPEWIENSGFSIDDFVNDQQILRFVCPQNDGETKWVLSLEKTGEPVAFCHFIKRKGGWIDVFGGMIKHFHNSATSIRSYVFALDNYFKSTSCTELHCAIYENNRRSMKMNMSMGFHVIGQMHYDVRLFNKLRLTKEDFYTSPVPIRLLKTI